MKKCLLTFAVGMLLSASAANAAKVYFENTDNWENVFSYCWNPEDQKPFPQSIEVTINDDKNVPHTLYYRETQEQENIIFLDASDWTEKNYQTGNLQVIDGAVYNRQSQYVADIIDGVYVRKAVEVVTESGYFLRGTFTTNWSALKAYQFKQEGEILTLTTTILAGAEFKIANSDWSTAWGYGNDKELTVSADNEYTLSTGGGNLVAGSDLNNVTLTLHMGTGKLMVSAAGKDPDIKWYCAWNINGSWVFGNEFEKQDEGTFKTVIEPTQGDNYFAVFQGMNNVNWNSGIRYTPIGQQDVEVTEGEVYPMQTGTNGSWKLPVQEGKGKWTVVVDPRYQAASTITFEWGSSVGVANVLIDRANDADHSFQSYEMTAVEGKANAFTWTGELAVGDKLKLNIHGDDYYYDPSNGTITSSATASDLVIEYPLILGIGEVTFNYGSSNVTIEVDVDPNDDTDSKVIVTIADAPNVSMTVTNGEHSEIYRVYKEGNTEIYKSQPITFQPGDQIDFRIKDTRYIPQLPAKYESSVMKTGTFSCNLTAAAASVAAPDFNFVTEPDQILNVEVDATKHLVTFTFDPETGVEGIEADDNAEAVYFNLQGVRVQNPENGMFIEVKGGKAMKVIK